MAEAREVIHRIARKKVRPKEQGISRRTLLKAGLVTGAAGLATGIGVVGVTKFIERKRESDRKETEALTKAKFSLERFIGQNAWVAIAKDPNDKVIVAASANMRTTTSYWSDATEQAYERPEYLLTGPILVLKDDNVGGYVGQEPNMIFLDRAEGEEKDLYTGNAWVLVIGKGLVTIKTLMDENDRMRRLIMSKSFEFIRGEVKRDDMGRIVLQPQKGEPILIGDRGPVAR